MSKLEELIKEKCPNGVKYLSLAEIVRAVNIGINPRRFFKLNPDNASGFYVTVRELNGLKGVKRYEKTDTINDEAIAIIGARANIEKGDILFSNTGTVGKLALVLEDPKNWGVNEGIYVIKPKFDMVLSKFLYYYLDSDIAYKDYSSKFTGSTLKHVTQAALLSIKVPVPPLEVQNEIVQILDNFAELTAELTAELSNRKKQYEYYRDLLLSFNENEQRERVKWLTIGEIGDIKMCKRILKSQTNSMAGIPFYKIGTFGGTANSYISEETFEEYKKKYSFPKKGDVLISAAGTIGRTVIYDGEPAYFQDSNIVWLEHDESLVLNKYLYYYYQLSPWQVSTGGTIARLYNDNILKAKIAVPSINEQKRIIHILDNFSVLASSISEGLPAEIEAREKQYAYYRDKLLTFEEAK